MAKGFRAHDARVQLQDRLVGDRRKGVIERFTAPVLIVILWAAVLAITSFGTSASASGTSLGMLSLTPATGLDTTVISVAFSSGSAACPTEAPASEVVVNGPGGWVAIALLADASTAGFSASSGQPTVSFQDVARQHGLTITAGRYSVLLLCKDPTGAVLATFDAPVFFTDAAHYQSTEPGQITQTMTTLAQSPVPAGSPPSSVMLTATTTPIAAGSVQFLDGGSSMGLPQPVSLGRATLLAPLAPGTHVISAVFSPADPLSSAGSTAPSITTVVAAPEPMATTTAVSVSGACAISEGTPVTFALTTTPAADGTIQLLDGAAEVGVPQTLSVGQGDLTVTLPVGDHDIGAAFTPSNPQVYSASAASALSCLVTDRQPSASPSPVLPSSKPAKHLTTGHRTTKHRTTRQRTKLAGKPKKSVQREGSGPMLASTWLTSAAYTGTGSQVLAAGALSVMSLTRSPVSSVPEPLLAGEEQRRPAGSAPAPAVASAAAVEYVAHQGKHVALLPSLLIVFAVTALVTAGYSKRSRLSRSRTRR